MREASRIGIELVNKLGVDFPMIRVRWISGEFYISNIQGKH